MRHRGHADEAHVGQRGEAGVGDVEGEGRLTSPTTVEVNGSTYTGTSVVLASGSYARTLPGLEIGGRIPVNTDGGLIANGEPIGASGLRQIIECVLQLQGRAGDRQVPGDPKTGFTQVYGAPGISACAVLAK